MSRFSSSGIYLNFPGFAEEHADLARAAYGENFGRLAQVKAEYDPDNLFRMNFNIPPARPAGKLRPDAPSSSDLEKPLAPDFRAPSAPGS